MISVAADFVNERRKSIMIPIILSLIMLPFIGWWIVTFMYIFSTGELRYDQGDIFGDMVWSN